MTFVLEGNSIFLSQALLVFSSSHNDFVLRLRIFYQNRLSKVNLREINKTHTNLAKLEAGYVGAQVRTVTAMILSENTILHLPHSLPNHRGISGLGFGFCY